MSETPLLPTPNALDAKGQQQPTGRWATQRSLTLVDWTSLPGDSPAQTSPTPARELALPESVELSGTSSREAFAYFDPGESSSRTCPESSPQWVATQASLLSERCSVIWPKRGMTRSGFAYELPTLALLTAESESSSSPEMLPTPAAYDDGKSPEAHRQMKANLPGGARTRITSLSVLARADFEQPTAPLLPTPGANDSTGGEGPTRDQRQREGETGGPQLRDIGHLLPTPMANTENPGSGGELRAALTHGPGRRNETGVDTMGRPNRGRTPADALLPTPVAKDADSARRETARTSDWKSHTGTTLTDAVQLLPTPTTQDAANTAGPSQFERNSEPLNVVATRLLPTPQAADGDGGRVERTAMMNQGKRPSGQKATLTLGTAVELRGELTSQPFSTGSSSSGEQPPSQLTIEDA